MSDAEIHDFGIEIVCDVLSKDGYEILRINTDLDVNPQILAKHNGELLHVTVRTACYPEKGSIRNVELCERILEYGAANSATVYFAPVGIANAEASTDEGLSVPVRGAGFVAAFNGLQIAESPEDFVFVDSQE